MMSLVQILEDVLDCPLVDREPLGVGFGLTGLKITLADGRRAAVKADVKAGPGRREGRPVKQGDFAISDHSQLMLEGYMLRELRDKSCLNVPEVYYCGPDMLVMEWIEGGGALGRAAQRHAAEVLAESHTSSSFRQGGRQGENGSGGGFGYERDTVIGPLHQPDGFQDKWVSFFRDKRLLYMARKAAGEGKLPQKLLERLEKLGEKLTDFLSEPSYPALLHGDLWTGNIIVGENRIAGFIDPAIYCGHPEIELAFTTMFGTFGRDFFEAYEVLAPLEPGFHDVRRELYNLYPTLVHVRLFGSGYLPPIHATLVKLGF